MVGNSERLTRYSVAEAHEKWRGRDVLTSQCVLREGHPDDAGIA